MVHCSCIYNYLCNQYLSTLTFWVWITIRQGILDTTLCDKLCQWLVEGWWFSQGIPVSSTNKTDRHDITEIFWKVAFNTITLNHRLKYCTWYLWIYKTYIHVTHIVLKILNYKQRCDIKSQHSKIHVAILDSPFYCIYTFCIHRIATFWLHTLIILVTSTVPVLILLYLYVNIRLTTW